MSKSVLNRTSTPSQTAQHVSSSPSQQNRKIVLVGETLHSAGTEIGQATTVGNEIRKSTVVDNELRKSPTAGSDASLSAEKNRKRSTAAPSRHSTDHSEHRQSGSSDVHYLVSPSGSRRSSKSSLLDAASNISSLVITPSSESKILEELEKQISSSASRIQQLEEEVRHIPVLNQKIEELLKERGVVANELLNQQEVVQSLKQRISLLHEQNGQLAKLVQAEKGGSSEVLAMRNALVASLAQLKQLQEQVNTIPLLKSQLKDLSEDNVELKEKESEFARHFPVRLPEGVEPVDYQTLEEENSHLKNTNRKLVAETKAVGQHLASVTASCDGLRKRMEMFEASQMQTAPLQERIKRLEAEKETLYEEVIDLKFNEQTPADIDVAQMRKEVGSLQKKNKHLRSKIEQMRMESRQQKEQLVLRLFEIEALNVKTHKYELEKQVLGMEQMQLHVDFDPHLRSASHSPDLDETSPDVLRSSVPPASSHELKVQMLKLQQLKVHSQQSHNVLHALLSDREELERKVVELNSQLDERGIMETENELENMVSKLEIARERIATLERQLHAATGGKTSQSSLAVENDILRSQVASLKAEHQQCLKLEQAHLQMEAKARDYDALVLNLEKEKEENRTFESKLKENKRKLRSIARELTGSVQLLKNYQDQCATLDKQLEQSRAEVHSVQEQCAMLKAQLEVKEVERGCAVSSGEYESLTIQHASLQKKFDDQKRKWQEDQARLESKLTSEIASLKLKNQTLQENLAQLKTSAEELCKETSCLQEGKDLEVELQLQKVTTENADLACNVDRLNSKIAQLTKDIAAERMEKSTLNRKVDALSAEAASLMKQNLELQMTHQRAEEEQILKIAEGDSLKQLVSDLEHHVALARASESEKTERLLVVQSDLDHAEEQLEQLTSEKERLLEEQAHLASKLKETTAEKEKELLSTVKKVEKQLEGVRNQLGKKTQDLLEIQQARSSVEQEVSRLRTIDLPQLQSECEAASKQRDCLAVELHGKVVLLKELEQCVQNRTSEVASLQQQLEAASADTAVKLGQSEYLLKQSRERVQSLETELQKSQQQHSELLSEHQKAKKSISKIEAQLQSKPESVCTQELETKLKQQEEEFKTFQRKQQHQRMEFGQLQRRSQTLSDEVEGYKATISSLRRQLDEAETREMEHELLRQKIRRLEQALGDSSQLKHDNKTLFTMLQEALTELPTFTTEANRTLQDENLRLEQQVSVLSQWNDKQRLEMEMLERKLEEQDSEKHQLLMELMAKENSEQENRQLKQELKEVEVEVNTLRRQVHEDLQEELQVKLKTQSQLLSVFNQHNTSLQKQVLDLLGQVRTLGGSLDREKPVSPPPMLDVTLMMQSGSAPLPEDVRSRTFSDMQKENEILKQRITVLEGELVKVQDISASVRRRSSSICAISSVPVAPLYADVQVSIPPEFLLPCSLLADSLPSNPQMDSTPVKEWLDLIRSEWFACMAQKSLSLACAQCYLTTLSRLSHKLLKIVINLQDDKGNTALHYAVANGNCDVMAQFIRLRCCNTNIANAAGYTPVMLSAACGVEVDKHKDVMELLMARSSVNFMGLQDGQTALMLAASSGSSEMLGMLLEAGAEINARDKDGSTALMFGCQNGHIEVVKKLLGDPSCDVNMKDNDGCTAIVIAKEAGNHDICVLINKRPKSK